MIALDWTAVLIGLATGAVVSAVFFAGLALGMRHALRGAHPVRALIVSTVVRIALLLGVGWGVVAFAGPWAFAGYGGAFLILRTLVTSFARAPKPAPQGPAP